MTDFAGIWTYLTQEPLLWLTMTLIAYGIGDAISRRVGRKPIANPVMIAVIILAVLLRVSGTDYPTYFQGAQFIHFMLGPATVALSVPLFLNLSRVRATLIPMLCALFAGSLTAILSAVSVAYAFGIRGEMLLSIAPKSATAPVAMGVSQEIGGSPTLTAVLVIITGVTGAIIVTPLLNALRVRDWRARGFAAGVAAHGIGTARALQVHPTAGAFAGVGMGLNALLTAIIAPWLIHLFL